MTKTTLALALAILAAGCKPQTPEQAAKEKQERIQRGAQLLPTYAHILQTAADWEKIPFMDRTAIAAFYGQATNANWSAMLTCLDTVAGDVRYGSIAFNEALKACKQRLTN